MDIHWFGQRLLWFAVVLIITGISHGNDESSTQNSTDAFNNEGEILTESERYRRLVPYMTFYLAQVVPQVYVQNTGTAEQYVVQNTQQYVPVVTITNKGETQQPHQFQHSALLRYPVYLTPYLLGNPQQGYKRIHIYSNAPIPISYSPYTHAPPHPTEISKLITQNYAATPSKQVSTKVSEVQTFPGPPSYSYSNAQYAKPIYETDLFKSNRYKPTVSQLTALKENIQPRYQLKQTPSVLTYPKTHIYSYVLHPWPKQRPSIKLQNDEDIVTITPSHEIEITEKTSTRLHKPTKIISQVPASSQHETTENIADIFPEYPVTKTFPNKIAPSNLGSTFQTLSQILKLLQRTKPLPQTPQINIKYKTPEDDKKAHTEEENEFVQNFPAPTSEGSTPGRPGVDYPIYDEIPETKFSCKEQRYKGFFGDPETNCQVWHYCDLNGGQASFLCPNGTIFSQVALTCDWWFNVKCASTAQLYVLNERLYKYILPLKPSFPEDFAGPVVDQYLSLKFHELEAKRKNSTKSHSKPKEATVPKT